MSPISHNLRRFLNLAPQQRAQLIQAFILVTGVRAGLTFLSFPRFRSCFRRALAAVHTKSSVRHHPTVEELAWTVRTASQYVPRATCLTQALAGQLFLKRHGYPSVVHIGVRHGHGTARDFEAHAWLESNGTIILGESEVRYVPLTALNSQS